MPGASRLEPCGYHRYVNWTKKSFNSKALTQTNRAYYLDMAFQTLAIEVGS